jgi:hypothetical protein
MLGRRSRRSQAGAEGVEVTKGNTCRVCHARGEWVRQPTAIGWQVRVVCLSCGRASSAWSRAETTALAVDVTDLRVWDPLGACLDSCSVCGRPGPLSRHHTAPRALFGDGCDLWPTVDICGLCHDDWHQRTNAPASYVQADRAALGCMYDEIQQSVALATLLQSEALELFVCWPVGWRR